MTSEMLYRYFKSTDVSYGGFDIINEKTGGGPIEDLDFEDDSGKIIVIGSYELKNTSKSASTADQRLIDLFRKENTEVQELHFKCADDECNDDNDDDYDDNDNDDDDDDNNEDDNDDNNDNNDDNYDDDNNDDNYDNDNNDNDNIEGAAEFILPDELFGGEEKKSSDDFNIEDNDLESNDFNILDNIEMDDTSEFNILTGAAEIEFNIFGNAEDEINDGIYNDGIEDEINDNIINDLDDIPVDRLNDEDLNEINSILHN